MLKTVYDWNYNKLIYKRIKDDAKCDNKCVRNVEIVSDSYTFKCSRLLTNLLCLFIFAHLKF